MRSFARPVKNNMKESINTLNIPSAFASLPLLVVDEEMGRSIEGRSKSIVLKHCQDYNIDMRKINDSQGDDAFDSSKESFIL
jgi:hypothetical protein